MVPGTIYTMLLSDAMTPIHTLGELRASGYRVQSVKDEMRANLLRKIAEIFNG